MCTIWDDLVHVCPTRSTSHSKQVTFRQGNDGRHHCRKLSPGPFGTSSSNSSRSGPLKGWELGSAICVSLCQLICLADCVSALACSAANDSYIISYTDYIIILVESCMLRKIHLVYLFFAQGGVDKTTVLSEKKHIISDSVCETLRIIVSCCIILDVTPCCVCFGCSFIGTRCTWHIITQGTQAPSSERVDSRMRWLLRQLSCGSAIRGLVMTGNPVQDPMKLLWVNLVRNDGGWGWWWSWWSWSWS